MLDALLSKAIAGLVFLAVYLLILLGLRELTVASLAGVAILLLTRILDPREMWLYVDFDLIALLMGTMVVIEALDDVGFFRWAGLHMANLARCDPLRTFLLFLLISLLLDAFTGDSIVVFLTMVATIMEISDLLEIDPRPLVLGLLFAVNIHISTPMSDLPPLLITLGGGFDFLEYMSNMWLPCYTSLGALLAVFIYLNKDAFLKMRPRYVRLPIRPEEVVRDKKLFWFSVSVFLAMIIGFMVGPYLGFSYGSVALIAAAILLIFAGGRIGPVLREVDWESIVSVMCLSMLVGGLEETGLIKDVAAILITGTGGGGPLGITIVLWLSSLTSAFIANIPYTIAMISVLRAMEAGGAHVYPLWWALAMGTGLGGNGTIVATYTNIVVVKEVSRRGYRIDPREFTRIGMMLVFLTTAITNLTLILMFA
ncbi:MAG: hypothetical protein DRN06_08645 [Thermoprotei archaeon]|nr:MAG: hypothetical protein DRN06_08645 [Thermoprotei archaeon]